MSVDRNNDSMTTSDAIAVMMAVVTVVACAVWFGYCVMGPAMQNRPKSDRQLCQERGGVYGELRGAGYRCFSPEAFK